MSKSTMVWATQYKLLVPISIKDGTFDPKGQKEEVGSKLVPRHYVEDRNKHNNNELWVIDEEKTSELMDKREESIVKNAEKVKKEKLTTADLIDVMAQGLKNNTKSSEPDESWNASELKEYCKENDISFKGNPGKKKLLELINGTDEE